MDDEGRDCDESSVDGSHRKPKRFLDPEATKRQPKQRSREGKNRKRNQKEDEIVLSAPRGFEEIELKRSSHVMASFEEREPDAKQKPENLARVCPGEGHDGLAPSGDRDGDEGIGQGVADCDDSEPEVTG